MINCCLNERINESEKNLKISYENNLMIKKFNELETRTRQYHPSKLKIKDCPAFTKISQLNNFSDFEIFKENKVNTI